MTLQRAAAGVVVFLSLIILADNDATATIGIAFAYLILLSVLMSAGPVAFGRISALVTGKPITASSDGKRK